MKAWPIWYIKTKYICDKEFKKVIATNRKWELVEIDIPARIY